MIVERLKNHRETAWYHHQSDTGDRYWRWRAGWE